MKARLLKVRPGIHDLGVDRRRGVSRSRLRRGSGMCRLRRVRRRWIGSGGGSGGYVVLWSTGRARSALLGIVTLLSDFSVYVAEVASDMMTLHAESIDRKRGLEDCE
jgi:hypothetical protein